MTRTPRAFSRPRPRSSRRAFALTVPLALAVALALSPRPGGADPRPESDAAAFAPVLAKAGLRRDQIRIDPRDVEMFGGGPYRTTTWQVFMDDPFKVPSYTERMREGLAAPERGFVGPLNFAFGRVGAAPRRDLLGDPNAAAAKAAAAPDALLAAIRAVRATARAAGTPDLPAEEADLAERCAAVPAELAEPMAFLLRVVAAAHRHHTLAFRALSRTEQEQLAGAAPRLASITRQASPDEARFVEEALARVDLAYLAACAGDLALAAAGAANKLRTYAGPRNLSFAAETPWGPVRVYGDGEDRIPLDLRPLLVIDLGGNDVYECGGSALGPDRPVSILLDLAGDDRYESPPGAPGSFGAGVLGCGFLIDLAGNDVYRGEEFTQGCGLFGAGALWDAGGDDAYHCLAYGQAAAFAGAGVLVDTAGKDTYDCLSFSQAYGYTLGGGVLVDHAGDDTYTANDTEIRNPSAQSKEHNVSMAQGCGFGKRADYLDGHSLAGGVGILVDHAGNDRYRCGVFGQGCGYWYGCGFLLDGGGDDEYHGVWYAQGAPAHFAIGVLADAAGNDRYTATMNMAQGAGHDFSLGMLIDGAGDDVYKAPNLSLGGGNDNGIGIFWDRAGNDRYEVGKSITLGAARISGGASLRREMRCLGLFLDGGGTDTYALPYPGDGKTWGMADAGYVPSGGEYGAGVDLGEAGSGAQPPRATD